MVWNRHVLPYREACACVLAMRFMLETSRISVPDYFPHHPLPLQPCQRHQKRGEQVGGFSLSRNNLAATTEELRGSLYLCEEVQYHMACTNTLLCSVHCNLLLYIGTYILLQSARETCFLQLLAFDTASTDPWPREFEAPARGSALFSPDVRCGVFL